MTPLDWAHEIGLTTISKDILTVDEGVCRWRIKNREVGNIFAPALGTRGYTVKRTPPLDSAHLIGVSPSRGRF